MDVVRIAFLGRASAPGERNTTACLSDRGVGDNESDGRLIGVVFRTGEANDKFSGHAPLHRGVE
jgi:hypothetical protein